MESFIPLVWGKEELGLSRIENLLEKLGNPEKKFKSVHVAGTSGKGTTAFYISRLLLEKGFKTGLHVSPHLVDIRERIVVNGEIISVSRFVDLVNEVKAVVDEIKSKQPHLTPSYFEILVSVSFLYFAREKVDYAVVEVGLGGRLDATNVLLPGVSVITNIGLDHTEILGDTQEAIAKEKAGIIKGQIPVVTGATGKALKVIEKVAKSKNAPLIKLNTRTLKISPKSDVVIDKSIYKDIVRYSQNRAVLECMFLAILAVLQLKISVSASVIKSAFLQKFPGRFEEISDWVILDGAHNPDKILSLINFISKSKVKTQKSKVSLVVAFKSGKNCKKMLDLLIKKLPIDQVIATEYQAVTDTGKGSAVPAEEIADYLSADKRLRTKVKVVKNSQEAVFEALSDKKEKDLVLVTGSLYLIGEARTLWYLPEF